MKHCSKSYKLGFLFILMLCIAGITLFLGPTSGFDWNIVSQIRLPRILLGMLVGAGLASAGAILQGVLRNPLADPFILGTSSAATAGIMIAGVLGLKHFSLLYCMALSFAVLSIFLVYRIAKVGNRTPVQTLILAGVIISLFFNAAVFVFFSVAYREAANILFFLLGSLTESEFLSLSVSGSIIMICLITSYFFAKDLNILTQGEESAHHLGINVERTKKHLFILASAMVAAAVAAAGMIGFVGLIVPHMMRMILGPDHRYLIPASALGGAIFLLLADSIARTMMPPIEIPVGALTALLGAPYFIYLLRKRQHQGIF